MWCKFRKSISLAIVILVFFVIGCSERLKESPKEKVAPEVETSKEVNEEKVKILTKENKAEVKRPEQETENVKVTFIELGSIKCIPCKMMQPIMKEVEEEYKNQVKVVFYDVWTEEGQPYAKKYGIRVIPTQVFLDKDGKEYFRHEGFFAKDELIKVLKMQGVE